MQHGLKIYLVKILALKEKKKVHGYSKKIWLMENMYSYLMVS